jgi:hypothetical protein
VPQPLFFSLIEDQQNYIFDGSITAWNPEGKNLIGKSLIQFSSDGLVKQPSVNYNWLTTTGTLEVIGKVYGDVVAGLIYQ